MKPAKVKRKIAPELMDEFKCAVQGSDLTKLGILEVLKKKFVPLVIEFLCAQANECTRFPKQSKDAIRGTLELVAERVGSTEPEKKWTLKGAQ